MTMTNDEMLQILEADMARKSPGARKTYLCINRKFLNESGDFSRAGMMKFLDNMGYCDNSIRTAHYALARLCRALGITFPLDEDDLPPPADESELYTPTMSLYDVEKCISYWKQFPEAYPTSLLFLSSMYGVRAIEMTDAEVGSVVTIEVAKKKRRRGSGIKRTHLIPSGLEGYLQGYTHFSERTVNYTFDQMCHQAGVVKPKKGGWHMIRRSLDTELIKLKVDRVLIKSFMRWARDRRDMSVVYFHMPHSEIDSEIFNVHPFLGFWK